MPTRSGLRGAVLALALAGAAAARLAAQTPDEPILIFTISAGYVTAGGDLWRVPRQLALAASSTGNSWDTVALARRLAPGFAATLSATIFKSPHFGWTAEAGFFGIGTTSLCSGVGSFASNQNQVACALLNEANFRGDAVGLLGGGVWRFTTGGPQPYLRAVGGLAILGSSYIEEAETIVSSTGTENLVYFLADRNHKELSYMLSLGAGVMLPLGPGYQLRIEARDMIVGLPYARGPAADTAAQAAGETLPTPPVGLRAMSIPTLTIGLDVVLERKRGHRY